MEYFNKEFIKFLKELSANNNKEWFDENRTRYEKEVKNPFKKFIDDLINELKKLEKDFDLDSKDAIFRINRDIRFSKDKTPYKTNVSAILSRGGRKDKSYPGLYVEFSPEHIRVYSGVYMPDKFQLEDIRFSIAENLKEFQSLVKNKKFVSAFGSIRGEKGKLLPKELKESAAKEPLIFNKQFYFFAEMKPSKATDATLMKEVMECYKTAKPLTDFFIKAMKR